MKKFFAILLICTLLTACAGETPPSETSIPLPETSAPMAETSPVYTYTLYIPNSNADGFDTKQIEAPEITPENVLTELQKAVVLTQNVFINAFHIEDGQLRIDFNSVFADIICTTGTAGEYMIMGSVVNTFLGAFNAESVLITVDGEILESGHVIYDFPITHME